MSFIALFPSAGIYFFIIKQYKKFCLHILISCILIASVYLYGSIRLNNNVTEYTDISVGIVQPSIKQEDKNKATTVQQHIDFCAKSNLDIIIWPESVFGIYEKTKHISYKYLADKINTNFIVGIDRIEPTAIYASAVGIDKNGQEIFVYDKRHLVPFGEYMPDFIPIKKLTSGVLNYSIGNTENIFCICGIKIRPLICYEAIFPVHEKADLLINIVNDAWYNTSPGPYQHFHISRLRAIETGSAMIRAANHGISAVIDGCGRIVKKTKLNQQTLLISKLPTKTINDTLYQLYGDILWILSLIIIVFVNRCIRYER